MAHLLTVLTLAPLLAMAGCGGTTPADEDELGSATLPPDALVVQVDRTGGFLPGGAAFSSLPSASLYGDGRVITPGAQIAVYPGPATPSVFTGQLDVPRVQDLVDDGLEVVAEEDYGQPPVADAPTTVVLVGAGERRRVARAVALDEAGDGPVSAAGGLTAEQRDARERLRAYVREVEDAATTAATQPYDAQGWAVLALPYGEPTPVEGPGAAELDWPASPLAEGEPVGTGRCVVVTGEELEQVRDAATQASQETAWRSGGEVWRLAIRPLLPHEQTCADVQEGAAPTP